MKPDYKNWMPKGMIYAGLSATLILFILFIVFGLTGILSGTIKTVVFIFFLIGTVVGVCASLWMILMYRAFDYNGKRKMSKQIIDGLAGYVDVPDGGKCLDVGCGSGALTIACAKRNPNSSFIGVDRWGKEYASFNQPLCENNAKAEGVENTSFQRGNATKLTFVDESFDAVCSNYVYHNIPGDRQAYLLETLRTLRKGGSFAIHDFFSNSKYGDMQAFLKKLRDMGYEKAELIDTTDGKLMSKFESVWMGLSGSALLVGKNKHNVFCRGLHSLDLTASNSEIK